MPILTRRSGWVLGMFVLLAVGCAPAPGARAAVASAARVGADTSIFGRTLGKPSLNQIRKCQNVQHPRDSGWQPIGPDGGFVLILPTHANKAIYVLWVEGMSQPVRFRMKEVEGKVAGVEIDAKDANDNPYTAPVHAWLLVDGQRCHGGPKPDEIGVALVSDADHMQIQDTLATLVVDRKGLVVQSVIDHLSTYLLGTN